jgi:hypothetical protein
MAFALNLAGPCKHEATSSQRRWRMHWLSCRRCAHTPPPLPLAATPQNSTQGASPGFSPNLTARLPDGSVHSFSYTPPFIPANVPSSVRLALPGAFSAFDDLHIGLDGWPQYTLLSLGDCAAAAGPGVAGVAPAQPPSLPPMPSAAALLHQEAHSSNVGPLTGQAGPPAPPRIIIVTKNIYGQDMGYVAAIAAASLQYHAVLGVSRWCASAWAGCHWRWRTPLVRHLQ